MVFEKAFALKTPKMSMSAGPEATFGPLIDSAICHLQALIETDDTEMLLTTTKALCETITEFLAKCEEFNLSDDDQLSIKCDILK